MFPLNRSCHTGKGSELIIEQVSKSFGSFEAVKNVSLTIHKGELFSLLGPSGCGKTTLLRIIAGFENPASGAVYLDGTNVLPIPSYKRSVNTVFQNYALFPHLTVFENVAFPLRLEKVSEETIRKKVNHYLELVKLPNEMKKFPSQLSGGQRQRVAIARALIGEPSVLLLDEPLSALDAKLRQHMLVELDSIHDNVGITFIFVTHDQSEALSVSDRVAVMNEGNILQIGTPFEIYESPSDRFVAEFIGDTNLLEGTVTAILDTEYALVAVNGVGNLNVFMDKPMAVGDTVTMTIRPEKIRISPEKPQSMEPNANLFPGTVDQLVYSGFQTKFYVHAEPGRVFRVYKQHAQFFNDTTAIHWQNSVWIWWNANDSFVVEVKSS